MILLSDMGSTTLIFQYTFSISGILCILPDNSNPPDLTGSLPISIAISHSPDILIKLPISAKIKENQGGKITRRLLFVAIDGSQL